MDGDCIEPIHLILIQGTSLCNLNCSYCYLTEDERKKNQAFPLEFIEPVFTKIFKSRFIDEEIQIAWHAGEPLTMPIDYYRQAWSMIDDLKDRYAPSGFRITHRVQTNATLLNQEWCDFFEDYKNRFLLGISCDGPDFIHDANRLDWTGGKTHSRVVDGIALAKKNSIPFRLYAVVAPDTLDYPHEVFDFFYQYRNDMHDGLIINLARQPASASVEYCRIENIEQKIDYFVSTILKRLRQAPAPMNIHNFAHLVSKIYDLPSEEEVSIQASPERYTPLRTVNIDTKANMSTFVAGIGLSTAEPKNLYGDNKGFMLGNLLSDDLEDIIQSSKFKKMRQDFLISDHACRSSCGFYAVCGGQTIVAKHEEHGRFDVAETTECRVQIQSFIKALLNDINEHCEK